MSHRIAFICILLAVVTLSLNVANSQPANVEFRIQGPSVTYPDTINGHPAMVIRGSAPEFVWSAKSERTLSGAYWGFCLDVSSGPVSTMQWISGPYSYNGWLSPTFWNFDFGYIGGDLDGALPDYPWTAGTAFPTAGFQSDTLIDILGAIVLFDDTGIVCIDSAFYPPYGEWLVCYETTSFECGPAEWGASVGGYPPGGYCFTVYEDCCQNPGDADGSNAVNIADVTFLIARIFNSGPAPECINEGDADGSHAINIGDVTYLVTRIFAGGDPPRCWWAPIETDEFLFAGIPDTIILAVCDSQITFTDTVSVTLNGLNMNATLTIPESGLGVENVTIEPINPGELEFTAILSAAQVGFIVIRASAPYNGGTQTDTTIFVRCQE